MICVRTKAEYFCAKGWTGFSDLPVVPVCRSPLREVALVREANQLAGRGADFTESVIRRLSASVGYASLTRPTKLLTFA